MADILSIFKEAHDVTGLWPTFSLYFKKNSIPNIQVNESIISQNARLPTTKAGLNKLKRIKLLEAGSFCRYPALG